MRSVPSCPTVSAAVRVLPRRSFQRAKRAPLRVKISAPGGRGLVTCFLNTVPTVHLPFGFRPAPFAAALVPGLEKYGCVQNERSRTEQGQRHRKVAVRVDDEQDYR